MTKWERIFKCLKVIGGGYGLYINGTLQRVGGGNTKPRAWKDACSALRLDKEKTSTTR